MVHEEEPIRKSLQFAPTTSPPRDPGCTRSLLHPLPATDRGEHCGEEQLLLSLSPAHTDFSVAQREHLGRVREWHGTFTWRVECRKQVDEERDHSQVRFVVGRDVEAEAGCEQSPGHVRESEQQEGSSAESVDGPDSRLSYVSAACFNLERFLSALTQAKTKLTRPKPKLAIRALRSLAPACLKTVEL